MKLITAIIRPEKLDAVKTALFAADVTGITLSQVAGHGGEKTVLDMYRGQPMAYEFHEKIQIDIAVSEPFVEATINAILSAAVTGSVGDGKIFVRSLERVIRIRTKEKDNDALTPITPEPAIAHTR